ncbi:hypothetical protein VTN00DRAFT_1116 [Thermoascus crustaceus]|uniref:uncharacterized protein n=1 Tax=Thermoascus crustaceus TaxID=5088 RepID=UPI0037443F85
MLRQRSLLFSAVPKISRWRERRAKRPRDGVTGFDASGHKVLRTARGDSSTWADEGDGADRMQGLWSPRRSQADAVSVVLQPTTSGGSHCHALAVMALPPAPLGELGEIARTPPPDLVIYLMFASLRFSGKALQQRHVDRRHTGYSWCALWKFWRLDCPFDHFLITPAVVLVPSS